MHIRLSHYHRKIDLARKKTRRPDTNIVNSNLWSTNENDKAHASISIASMTQRMLRQQCNINVPLQDLHLL